MTKIFELHTDQLDENFLASVKAEFPHRTVEIAVTGADEQDETEYLLSDPARRERLLRAVEDVKAGRNLITPDQSIFQ